MPRLDWWDLVGPRVALEELAERTLSRSRTTTVFADEDIAADVYYSLLERRPSTDRIGLTSHETSSDHAIAAAVVHELGLDLDLTQTISADRLHEAGHGEMVWVEFSTDADVGAWLDFAERLDQTGKNLRRSERLSTLTALTASSSSAATDDAHWWWGVIGYADALTFAQQLLVDVPNADRSDAALIVELAGPDLELAASIATRAAAPGFNVDSAALHQLELLEPTGGVAADAIASATRTSPGATTTEWGLGGVEWFDGRLWTHPRNAASTHAAVCAARRAAQLRTILPAVELLRTHVLRHIIESRGATPHALSKLDAPLNVEISYLAEIGYQLGQHLDDDERKALKMAQRFRNDCSHLTDHVSPTSRAKMRGLLSRSWLGSVTGF